MGWRTQALWKLYTNQTAQEIEVHKQLAARCRLRILPQLPLSKFFVDFAIPELGVIVEVDDPKHEKKQEYDEARTKVLESMGWLVYRCTNAEVDHDPSGTVDRIWNQISKERENYNGTVEYGKSTSRRRGGSGGTRRRRNPPPIRVSADEE